MLNDMALQLTEAGARRYFKEIDTSGLGRINEKEFTNSLYTKNTTKKGDTVIRFTPAKILDPKVLFLLFDADESSSIDRSEYAGKVMN